MVAYIRFGSEAFFLRSFGSMKPLGWFWPGFGKGFGREPQGRRCFRARKRDLYAQKEKTTWLYAWFSQETGGRYGNEDGCACGSSREWRRA